MAFLISRDFPPMSRPDMSYGIIYLPGINDLMGRCIDMIERLGLKASRVVET